MLGFTLRNRGRLRRAVPRGRGRFLRTELTSEGSDIAIDEWAARDGDTYRGVLIEEHHGGVPNKLAKVQGTVRRLWVLSQRFRREGRMWRPMPGEVRLAEVERMPDVFELDHEGSDRWSEIGALAQLELK